MDHYVTIVGYKEDPKAVPGCSGYWIVKNSYGPIWGEGGFFRVCIPSDPSKYPMGTCNLHQTIAIPDVGLIPSSVFATA
jgi:hypothetical protein